MPFAPAEEAEASEVEHLPQRDERHDTNGAEIAEGRVELGHIVWVYDLPDGI